MARQFVQASGQVIEQSSGIDYIDGATSVSIAFWYNNTDNTDQKPIGQWNGLFNQSTFLIEKDTSGRIGLIVTDTIGNSSSRRLALANPLGTGTAHFFVFTWTATDTFTIYVDGVSQTLEAWIGGGGNTGISAIGSASNRPKLSIGRDASSGYVNGNMAEFAIWKNRVISLIEAQALANSFSPLLLPDNLVFYSRLLGSGSSEPDIIGAQYGTVTGATAATHPAIIMPNSLASLGAGT